MSKSVYSTKIKTYNNYDQALNILENRKKTTYQLEGIDSVSFNDYGNLEIGYIVKETDEMNYGIYSSEKVVKLYTPKYVWNHLVSMLNLPSRLYDYIEAFKRLDNSELDIALMNFSDNIKMLMNYRIEQQKKNSRLRTHYISVFDDIFGKFPRVIRSELYRPYKDSKALQDFDKNLERVNRNSDANFFFKRARLSPYRSTFEYLNDKSTDSLENNREKISHGVVNYNSETKDSSNGFEYLIMRLICTNGLYSTELDNSVRVRHIGDDFSIRSQKAFIQTLRLGQDFAKMFYELDKKDKVISNDWNDLYEIPSNLLAMRDNEKRELIEIANNEDYKLSGYGLVQALTYKSNHKTNNDKSFERLNEKAISIAKNIDKFNKWSPKRLTNQDKQNKKPKSLDVNDLEFM